MRITIAALALVAVLGLVAPVRADVMYDYTGQLFTTCPLIPTCSDKITGSITLSAPFPSNFIGSVTPIAFTFTSNNSFEPFTNLSPQFDPPAFDFAIINGVFVQWDVEVVTSSIELLRITSVGDGNEEIGAFASNTTPGSWSGPIALTVPEPASLAIFGAGLAAFSVMRRKRKAS